MTSPATAQATRAPAAAARARPLDETHTDLLRLDLRDVPYMSQGLHVEALRPSLFSRLMGFFIR